MRGLSLPYISPPPGIDIRKIWGYLEGSGDAWKDALFLRRCAPALQNTAVPYSWKISSGAGVLLLGYFDYYVSSSVAGYRKPNCKGLQMISEKYYKVGFYWR